MVFLVPVRRGDHWLQLAWTNGKTRYFGKFASLPEAERWIASLVGDIDPNLTIRAQQRKDGTWCVCTTPSCGPSTYIGDFKSEVEAQNWIIHKAKDHFPRRKRPVLESC